MTRLFDVNGQVIVHPPGFDSAVNALKGMIDYMERTDVDRSDMQAMLDVVMGEARFHLVFLPKRSRAT